jgi:hypothetical protein
MPSHAQRFYDEIKNAHATYKANLGENDEAEVRLYLSSGLEIVCISLKPLDDDLLLIEGLNRKKEKVFAVVQPQNVHAVIAKEAKSKGAIGFNPKGNK